MKDVHNYHRAAEHLAGVIARGSRPAYEHAEAFSAFIRGGGTRQLCRAVNEPLRGIYRELAPGFRVADAGVGDGLAVLPAIDGIDAALTVIEHACKDQHGAREIRLRRRRHGKVIWTCWQQRVPYDPTKHRAAQPFPLRLVDQEAA